MNKPEPAPIRVRKIARCEVAEESLRDLLFEHLVRKGAVPQEGRVVAVNIPTDKGAAIMAGAPGAHLVIDVLVGDESTESD